MSRWRDSRCAAESRIGEVASILLGTTAAWRLQIGVWQNMSFQSNHPE
ncbi:hypothetical protein [Escherichia coli]|nr:hypothetical protein [Escherichia coli]